jgi:diphthamide biosynthesis protein 7
MSTTKLQQYDTELTADTVEWCPTANYREIAACGTYQLDSSTERRHGSLSFHKLERAETKEQGCVKVLQRKDLDYGILDMKWRVQSARPLLALAASSGDVVFGTLAITSVSQCI